MHKARNRQHDTPSSVKRSGCDRPFGCVVDLFCGAGGLSHGFRSEGFLIGCGYDTDEDCRFPFEENNKAPLLQRDVTTVDPDELVANFAPGLPMGLIGMRSMPAVLLVLAWDADGRSGACSRTSHGLPGTSVRMS